MDSSFNKEFKVLKNVSYFILFAISLYFLITIYLAKEILFVRNEFSLDYIIVIAIVFSISILIINTIIYKKNRLKVSNYKGLVRNRVKNYIDITILYIIILELPVLINITFFHKTKNILFVYIAAIFLIFLIKKGLDLVKVKKI